MEHFVPCQGALKSFPEIFCRYFLLVPGFHATNLLGRLLWNLLERTSCKVNLYHFLDSRKCCSITFLFSFHLLLPDKLQCPPGTKFCHMRKDIKLNNKTKKQRWDPALCDKMTICSVEAFFYVSPLPGNALKNIGWYTFTSFKQERVSLQVSLCLNPAVCLNCAAKCNSQAALAVDVKHPGLFLCYAFDMHEVDFAVFLPPAGYCIWPAADWGHFLFSSELSGDKRLRSIVAESLKRLKYCAHFKLRYNREHTHMLLRILSAKYIQILGFCWNADMNVNIVPPNPATCLENQAENSKPAEICSCWETWNCPKNCSVLSSRIHV